MNKEDIIIFGTGKVAEIVYSCIIHDENSKWNPIVFTVDREYMRETVKFGIPIVPFDDIENIYHPDKYKMLIAVGYYKMNCIRDTKCNEAKDKGYELVSYIHSKVDIAQHITIGVNTIILSDVSIGAYSNIGDNVFVYCNATISHHVNIKSNVWMASGSVIGGNTTIGNNCFLGINSTIAHNISVGINNFIGANSIITKSTEDNSVYIVPDTPKYRLETDMFMRLSGFD